MLQLRQYELSISSFNFIIPAFMRSIDIADKIAEDRQALINYADNILQYDYDTIDNVTDIVGFNGYHAIFNCINWIDKESNIYKNKLIGFQLVAYE